MELIKQRLYLFLFMLTLPFALCACGGGEDELPSDDGGNDNQGTTIVIPPVTELKAEKTQTAKELQISWTNPSGITMVELSYYLDGNDESDAIITTVKIAGQTKGNKSIMVPEYGTYQISAVAMDNYGRRSERTKTTGTPAETDFVMDWASLADDCTYVLIEQFMNKKKGTFWSTPQDVSGTSWNIYWQQAHAMDVVVYSYERIRDKKPELADTYKNYFRLWFENKANNYNKDSNDNTGFLNPFTDDMCWICLTLMHMTEATEDVVYLNMAREIYDKYIITRALKDDKGTGLPWKNNNNNRNACTNSPGCLIAAKLYKKFGNEQYLSDAKMLYDYMVNNSLKNDGRVEEPPLTYTQGTFGEACRQLYHITGDTQYMRMAEKVISYTTTSNRCLTNGILRNEGTSMDNSLFKAVFIPYAVNMILDDKVLPSVRIDLKAFLIKNAEALRDNLDRTRWPAMYCNYYWGSMFPYNEPASMGAQASGASLMEGVARMSGN